MKHILCACLLAAASLVPRTAVARALTLQDYYRVVGVQAPAMSPDGKWVAFIRSTIVEAENRRQGELWIVPADGSAPPRRLSDPAMSASGPRWSPDGRLLAFSGRRRGAPAADEGGSIWFLRADRLDEAPIQIPGVEGTPIFSPDNKWIAFTKRVARPKAASYATDAEKTINERFKGKAYEWIQYRFDQRGYLPDPRDPEATPPDAIFIVSRDGGAARQLTQLTVTVTTPVWRPDSQALAFIANEHQRDEYVYPRADLWTVALDGKTTRLTDDGNDHDSPAWSPDGKTIAVRREQGLSAVIASKQNFGAPSDVVLIAADVLGRATNLTGGWDYLPGPPSFSPDGAWVYFSAGLGGTTHLMRVPAPPAERGARAVQQVTTGDRQLTNVSPNAAWASMAYVAGDSAHPDELFVSSIDGKGEKKLTSFNDDFVREIDATAADRILYKSKDGTPIEGWVLKPRGYDASRAWPLILAMHGGPHGAYGQSFSFEHQLFAANGYLVVYTNPRGSTNYGEKFLWATWGGWGNLDFEDVMAGVDYAKTKYTVDEKRMGVTGYSYGGFLTNWVITHTTRFAAAIAGAGISNWLSDYATSDIPRTKESEFFGAPWEAKGREILWMQSPIAYAGKAKTPTLFVNGEADARVPIEEAEQMYLALRKQRVPARMVRYPDTYHGGWTPWNTVHRYYEELKWWQRYLDTAKTTSSAQ